MLAANRAFELDEWCEVISCNGRVLGGLYKMSIEDGSGVGHDEQRVAEKEAANSTPKLA